MGGAPSYASAGMGLGRVKDGGHKGNLPQAQFGIPANMVLFMSWEGSADEDFFKEDVLTIWLFSKS